MKNVVHVPVLVAAFVVSLTTACGPDPKEVCAHVADVGKKEGTKPLPNCDFALKMMKEMKPSAYRTAGGCLNSAGTTADINKCIDALPKE